MNKPLVVALLTGVLVAGASVANAADNADKEKCYGVAKAGKNDCKTAAHECAGKAVKDNDPAEFVLVAKGECAKQGGHTEAK